MKSRHVEIGDVEDAGSTEVLKTRLTPRERRVRDLESEIVARHRLEIESVIVATQAELDAAIREGKDGVPRRIVCRGDQELWLGSGYVEVRDRVELRLLTSEATCDAFDNATVRTGFGGGTGGGTATLWDKSVGYIGGDGHGIAWGDSELHLFDEATGAIHEDARAFVSDQAFLVAWEGAVEASDQATIRAQYDSKVKVVEGDFTDGSQVVVIVENRDVEVTEEAADPITVDRPVYWD